MDNTNFDIIEKRDNEMVVRAKTLTNAGRKISATLDSVSSGSGVYRPE